MLEEGAVARRQLVALGQDLVIAGDASSDAVAVGGGVRVTGSVEGDVIVLGGDAVLGASAVVRGDVLVLGGRLEAAPGARIEGRSVAYPSVGAAWLVLLEGPSLGQSPFSGVIVAAKLALVAAWLAWTLVLFATSGRSVVSVSRAVSEQPFRSFLVGLSGVLAAFLTAIFFAALASQVVGMPLLFLIILLALLLKLWGMVGVFHAFGGWLAGRLSRRRVTPLNAAVLGLAVLGAVKLLPWLGVWAWTAATLVGIGATLTTKFGRREPWLEELGVDPKVASA